MRILKPDIIREAKLQWMERQEVPGEEIISESLAITQVKEMSKANKGYGKHWSKDMSGLLLQPLRSHSLPEKKE